MSRKFGITVKGLSTEPFPTLRHLPLSTPIKRFSPSLETPFRFSYFIFLAGGAPAPPRPLPLPRPYRAKTLSPLLAPNIKNFQNGCFGMRTKRLVEREDGNKKKDSEVGAGYKVKRKGWGQQSGPWRRLLSFTASLGDNFNKNTTASKTRISILGNSENGVFTTLKILYFLSEIKRPSHSISMDGPRRNPFIDMIVDRFIFKITKLSPPPSLAYLYLKQVGLHGLVFTVLMLEG